MKPNGIPETDAEADLLRAYIPAETLTAIAKIRDAEIAESEARRAKLDEAYENIAAIKERMRKERVALKKWKAVQQSYFSAPLFARTDAARDAAWIAAAQARRDAIARGETLRTESVKECGARQKASTAIYTP